MNSENLEFLQNNLMYLGFGDAIGSENKIKLNKEVKEYILNETKEFQVKVEAFYDDDYKVEAILHFRKADNADLYFFNKYEALLRKADAPDRDRKQTFYISKGSGVTLKEAYNLLQGRAVNKNLVGIEGDRYNAWIQLNFDEMTPGHNYRMRQFREQYGYELEKVLEKYPITELQTEESKVALYKALKRGNLQPVHFQKSNNVEKMFIEANPQFKTITIYSSTMNALQKQFKKQDKVVKVILPEKPGGAGNEELGDDISIAVEEEAEESREATVGNPAPAKRRRS